MNLGNLLNQLSAKARGDRPPKVRRRDVLGVQKELGLQDIPVEIRPNLKGKHGIRIDFDKNLTQAVLSYRPRALLRVLQHTARVHPDDYPVKTILRREFAHILAHKAGSRNEHALIRKYRPRGE